MIVARRNSITGAVLLVVLMAVTLLPFISMFTSALFPSGTYPLGISWPAHPQWGNFVQAFNVANMGAIFESSVSIVIGVVPVSVLIATLAGFALGHLKIRGGQVAFFLFVLGLTLPFEGVIVPIYYEMRDLDLLGRRWAIILPLIGLFMPFGVYWMRAHFIGAAPRALRGRSRRRGYHLAVVLASARPSRTACACVTRDPAIGLDLEPVPPLARARGQPHERDDGRGARCLPRAVGH